jgi:low temperature requirement protein LtrA
MLAGMRALPPRPRPSAAGPLSTAEDQSATYVELFFDLVFVYAITQLVVLLAHDVSWVGVGKVTILFWLVWWAWTQYTWALNSADTNHPWIEAGTLLATGMAFFLSVTVGDAYTTSGGWFAAMYVLVRLIGLWLYAGVAREDPRKRYALGRFAALSTLGLAAVLAGGAVDGDARVALWCAAIALDLFAGVVAGANEGWDIRPDHFGERHALFVIITLGESLIVAASGLSDHERTASLVVVGALAVALSGALWWCYFVRCRALLAHVVEQRPGQARIGLSRNVYSFLHFPICLGVMLVAVGVEHAVADPTHALSDADVVVLVGGVALYLGGMAAALALAERRVRWPRLAGIALVASAAGALHAQPVAWTLAAVVVGTAAVAVVEQRTLPAPTRHAPSPATEPAELLPVTEGLHPSDGGSPGR